MRRSERISRRLKLRHLDVLQVVVQWGSMAKAAEHLAISQPVVSKTIADLENTLGVRLLDRKPHGVEPRLTALVILDRLTARSPGQFGPPQHTIVQRLLKDLRREAAGKLIAEAGAVAAATAPASKAAIFSGSKAPPLLPLAPRMAARSPT